MSTLDPNAVIGTSANGGNVYLSSITAAAQSAGLPTDLVTSFMPSSLSGYSSVVYQSADGTAITLGNVNSIIAANTGTNYSTVLSSIYTTNAADFNVTFSTNVLNGTTKLKTAEDIANTTTQEAKTFFKDIFGVDPTEAQLTSFVGKSEADAKNLAAEQFRLSKLSETEFRLEAARQTDLAEMARLAKDGAGQAAAEAAALKATQEANKIKETRLGLTQQRHKTSSTPKQSWQ